MPIPAGYYEHIATPNAQRSVERHWTFRATEDGSSIILPDGRSDLIVRFQVGANDTAHSVIPVVAGPATCPFTIRYKTGDMWIGLRLRPELSGFLWGWGAAPLANQVHRGAGAIALIPELAAVSSVDGIAELEQSLNGVSKKIGARNPNPDVTKALKLCHLTGGRISVAQISRHLSCSSRQLLRLFKANIGLGPKDYVSIVRFHRALGLMKHQRLCAIDAAAEAGYADQSHMVRSFRRFGGFSPSNIPTNLSLPGLGV